MVASLHLSHSILANDGGQIAQRMVEATLLLQLLPRMMVKIYLGRKNAHHCCSSSSAVLQSHTLHRLVFLACGGGGMPRFYYD